jgi:hypothetical protein
MVWPLVRNQLLLGAGLAVLLLLIGKPEMAFGLFYGALLGTINALAMLRRLEGAVSLGDSLGRRFLQLGVATRFALMLGLMAIGFYFFKLHVAALIVGFILFQFVGLIALWREMKRAMPAKTA